ncbi:MAG: hypothetical protein WDM94_12165 [Bauldia sp.]
MLLKTLLTTTAVALAAPALAADFSEPTTFLASPVSGYLEAYFGIGQSSGSSVSTGLVALDVVGGNDFRYTNTMFGGSGRLAYALAPNFSVQADGWFDSDLAQNYFGGDVLTYSSASTGLGLHGTWRGMNTAFGGLISIGQNGAPARYANLAAEGAWYGATSSFTVQGGYTVKFAGAPFSESGYYGHAVATFFQNPNLALSGDVGVTNQSAAENDGYASSSGNAVQWGARVDYKPEQVPFSFFVAYQGSSTSASFNSDYGSNSSTSTGTSHAAFIGARYLFGSDTLQNLDRTVGFKDHNALFGANALGSIAPYD